MVKQRWCAIFLPWIVAAGTALAQGFPWVVSARLPFAHPRWYVGVEGSAAIEYHQGTFRNLEGGILCATYHTAYGQQRGVGVVAEYWMRADRAVSGVVRWMQRQARFTERSAPIPQKDSLGDSLPPLVTEYEFVPTLQQLQLGVRLKQRLLLRYLFAMAEVNATFLLSYTGKQRERIVSPPERRFADGSYERTIPFLPVTQLATLNIGAQVGIGMDLPIAYRVYASPVVQLGLPLFPLEQQSSWRSVSLRVALALYVGL